MTAELWGVLAGGFLGSSHCIGMCGGFAGAVGAGRRSLAPILARQLVYNFGRIFTYAFMGCLAGSFGVQAAGVRVGPMTAGQILSMAAGLFMLLVGLSAVGVMGLTWRWTSVLSGALSPVFTYFLNARGWMGYLTVGLVNGFLPCGLVYSFLALAAATGAPFAGMRLMIVFGLGTVPAMLLVGCGARWLTLGGRRRIYRLAGVFVIGFGLLTIWRGWPRNDMGCCHDDGAMAVSQ